VDREHAEISVRRQCELLGANRSGLYYEPVGESEENLTLMRLLDQQYTRTPFYGGRKMVEWLDTQGFRVNRKRVSRLMDLMGIEAVYPKPKLSQPGDGHKVYPYLLRGVEVCRVNQVWSTDITYIRMAQGFVYLVAVMDWFSRYVLSWRLSLTMELDFCVEALKCALRRGRPEIFNSDQGSQFTSEKFTGELAEREIAISMDGRGRFMDNIFIERLWRSLKYEEVYLKDYETVAEARTGIEKYFRFYNQERLHQSLEYRTPAAVWLGRA
jgi:putative transposase